MAYLSAMERTPEILLGQTLALTSPDPETARHDSRGALLVEAGRIAAMGTADDLRRAHPRATVTDYGDRLILPGFIDAHVHYPQTAIIASWGKRLIDWLNSYTFPEEMRFADADYAAEVACRFFDLSLGNGTTTVASYCTTHPESVTAFFEEAGRRGLRAIAGKTCMDRNAPEGLLDTARRAYDESKTLIEAWHGKDRLAYAITPRFTPTSTPEQLHALGALWAENPDCLMQTHLSEQTDEIAWVKELCPDARDYLDTYEAAGLLGERALFTASGWPPTPAVAPPSRCCAPWRRPTRSPSFAATPSTPRNSSGWPPAPRRSRSGRKTTSAASPPAWRPTSSSSTSPRPRASRNGRRAPKPSGRRSSPPS